MGKKKNKSPKVSSHEKNQKNTIEDDVNVNVNTTSCRKNHHSYFPSPSLTKEVFILLSLSGHLNAIEYSTFLEDIEARDPNINNYHDDDDMDDIILAMDTYDQDRQSFTSSLHDIAIALLELIKSSEAHPKSESLSSSSATAAASSATAATIDVTTMENLEESCSQFHQKIQMYKRSIRNQRKYVNKCRQNITQIINQKNTILLSSPSVIVDENTTNLSTIETLRWMNQSNNHDWKTIIDEFIHQLHWERIVITKLEETLSNGSLYACFCDNNDFNVMNHYQEDDIHNHASKQSTISLCKDMIRWSSTVGKCSLLNRTKWICVKESLLQKLSFDMEKSDNHLTVFVLKQNEERQQHRLNQDNYVDETQNAQMHRTCVDYERKESNMLMMRNVLSCTTLVDAINTFFDQNILSTRSRMPMTAQCSEKESQRIRNSDKQVFNDDNPTRREKLKKRQSEIGPMFFLLVGSSNSGKTYFCNMLQSDICHNNLQVKGKD